MRLSAHLLAVATMALSLGPSPSQADRALIVGADIYAANPSWNLPGARTDALAMYDLLIDVYGFQPNEIRLLTGPEASRKGILRGFEEWLIADTRPGDRVFFYFSGHGALTPDLDGDEPDGFDQALVPTDARLVRPELAGSGAVAMYAEPPGADPANPPAPLAAINLIIDDEIGALLARLEGRQVTAVIDSCFSGTATRGLRADTSDVRPRSLMHASGLSLIARTEPGRSRARSAAGLRSRGVDWAVTVDPRSGAWSSASRSQVAFETSEGGVFTSAFIAALRAAAAEGRSITNGELLQKTRAVSDEFCGAHAPCRSLNGGRLDPAFEGDIALLLHDAITGAPPADAPVADILDILDDLYAEEPFSVSVLVQGRAGPGSAAEFELGERLRLAVTSEISGRLVLLDQSPDGNLYLIHPNPNAAAPVSLAGGEMFTLPRAFRMRTAGSGQLIAIVTEDEIDLSDFMEASPDGTISSDRMRRQALAHFQRAWDEIVDGMVQPVGLRWSFGVLNYDVAR